MDTNLTHTIPSNKKPSKSLKRTETELPVTQKKLKAAKKNTERLEDTIRDLKRTAREGNNAMVLSPGDLSAYKKELMDEGFLCKIENKDLHIVNSALQKCEDLTDTAMGYFKIIGRNYYRKV